MTTIVSNLVNPVNPNLLSQTKEAKPKELKLNDQSEAFLEHLLNEGYPIQPFLPRIRAYVRENNGKGLIQILDEVFDYLGRHGVMVSGKRG
jgi:hypothetical protein